VYHYFDDLLSFEQIDTVHILTPPPTHAAIAEKAILAGCHVLVEKPMTETVVEFTRLAELANTQKKVLCANYSTLGMPVVIRARQKIASGKLGRLIAVHCTYAATWPGNTIPYGDPKHWSYGLSGGVLQNWADHPASIILSVMDPIEEHKVIFVSRNILPFNSPDLMHVAVRNQDQVGSFTLSLGHGNTEIRAHFILEGGTIVLDIRRMLIACMSGKGPQNIIKRAMSGISESYSLAFGTMGNVFAIMTKKLQREPGIFNVIQNFYKTIEQKEKLIVTHEITLGVIKLLEEGWKELRQRNHFIGRENIHDHVCGEVLPNIDI
jgi:predicted dehydrogenase